MGRNSKSKHEIESSSSDDSDDPSSYPYDEPNSSDE